MYVERLIDENFKKILPVYNIIAIVGARQSGKTTFLKQKIMPLHSSYVMFDDPDARSLFEEDIKKFEKQYLEGYEVSVLDEVQYCKDAGMKLKYLADKGRRVWITSSSEIILGKEILSYLVGRVSIIKLYPFSLQECLNSQGQKEVTSTILRRRVWEHAMYGGYPKVVMTKEPELKKIILRDLYETMLLKDMARTFSIDDIGSLELFAKYLSVNTGGLLSYDSISKTMKLSFQSVKKYLDAMEKSYLIVRVPPFFTNRTKEIIKQSKVYFVDTGLRNTVAKEFDAELKGNVFENYVLMELIKMGFSPKHWRTKSKAEVDFVVEMDNAVIPVEVKLGAQPGKIERSLRSFIETYSPERALVVSYRGETGRMTVDGCEVVFTDVLRMREHLLGRNEGN